MYYGQQNRQIPRFPSPLYAVYVERAYEFPTQANAYQRSVTESSLGYLLCYPWAETLRTLVTYGWPGRAHGQNTDLVYLASSRPSGSV